MGALRLICRLLPQADDYSLPFWAIPYKRALSPGRLVGILSIVLVSRPPVITDLGNFMEPMLIVVLLVVLLGGGGFWGFRRWR